MAGNYLGPVVIGQTLPFYLNTHGSTGAETDADAVPSYRVYEQTTDTAILSGVMAKIDDANTTGAYAGSISINVSNGFEVGKNYAIRKRAVVASVAAAEFDTFICVADVLGTSPLATAASIALLQTYPKNTAVTKFGFAMYLTDGTLATGVTVTGTISKDGGNFASITDSPAEIQTSGCYEVDLTQTEMNADEIILKFTATGARPLVVKIRTQG